MKLLIQLILGLGFINIILIPFIIVLFIYSPIFILGMIVLIPCLSFIDVVFGISESKQKKRDDESKIIEVAREKIESEYEADEEKIRLDTKLEAAYTNKLSKIEAYDRNPTDENSEAEMEAGSEYSAVQREVDDYYNKWMNKRPEFKLH